MTRTQQSFGEQAARFSLYAPLLVLCLGLLTYGNRDQPVVIIGLPILNITLIIAGLVLGIAALISMRRLGARRILGRAIVGVSANGLVLTFLCVFLLPLVAAGHVKKQVVGHWRLQHGIATAGHGPLDLVLNADGTFRLDGVDAKAGAVAIQGTWSMNRRREIGMQMKLVNGQPRPAAAKPLGLGTVRSVSDTHLSLGTDAGTEEYDRVP